MSISHNDDDDYTEKSSKKEKWILMTILFSIIFSFLLFSNTGCAVVISKPQTSWSSSSVNLLELSWQKTTTIPKNIFQWGSNLYRSTLWFFCPYLVFSKDFFTIEIPLSRNNLHAFYPQFDKLPIKLYKMDIQLC